MRGSDMIASAIGFPRQRPGRATPVAIHLYIFRNDASYRKLRARSTGAQTWVIDPDGYGRSMPRPTCWPARVLADVVLKAACVTGSHRRGRRGQAKPSFAIWPAVRV
jgi:hypothetical protein